MRPISLKILTKIFFLLFCLILPLTFSAQVKYFQKQLDSSNYYIRNGHYYRAIELLSGLEKKLGKNIPLPQQYLLYNLYGKAIAESGDPGNAAIQYQKGMDIAVTNKDSIAMANFYMMLAKVNVHSLGELALHQLNEAEMIFQKLNRKDLMGQLYFRKGVYYSFMANIDSCNYYFDRALPAPDSILHIMHMNKGVAYNVKGDMKSAMKHTRIAMAILKRINDEKNLSICLGNYASMLNETGQLDSSLFYSYKGLELANKTNHFRAKIVAYNNLIDLSKKKKDYKTAFLCLERSKVLTDSFTHAKKTLATLKNQLDHEYKDKESQLKFKNLLQEKQASEKLLKQKQFTYTVTIVLIMLAIGAFVLYGRFKVIRKQKLLIESQKSSLEEKNHLIEEKQKEILESIRYARRIQQAHMPHQKSIAKHIERLRK